MKKVGESNLILNRTVLVCFALILLAPHGVGISHPFGLPNIDLPRISFLILFLAASTVIWKTGLVAPRSRAVRFLQVGLLICGLWQFVAAAAAQTPTGSLLWAAGNWFIIWGFALAVVSQPDFQRHPERLTSILFYVGLILAIWGTGEWLTQERLITNRNAWSPDVVGQLQSLSRLYRLSFGPYPDNHYLGIALCASSGFLLVGSRARTWIGVALSLAVLSTVFRAAWIAFFIILLTNFIRSKERLQVKTWLPILVFAGGAAILFNNGILTGDLTNSGNSTYSENNAHSRIVASSNDVAHPGNREDLLSCNPDGGLNPAHLRTRAIAIFCSMSQVIDHASMGFGPGVRKDIRRVQSDLKMPATDLGAIFEVFVESGLGVGLWLVGILSWSVIVGIRSNDEMARSAGLGLLGIFICALSSPTTYFLGLALVLAGLIQVRMEASQCR